ncbi:hypothetical protein PoB_004742000 [Plakobranchus ocellatus]|uniref:Uncharacterized protein n=1 Tax=Plakobranchus ocellatus TaxID=259542 RepID=A0AAV4BNA3_9GAST|nr:hypothetical protein PoB_004742000 [Plakobranchus ocellatus]
MAVPKVCVQRVHRQATSKHIKDCSVRQVRHSWFGSNLTKAEPTLEAAVHVSNNTCFEILWARARQVGCYIHLLEALGLSFVFYSLVLRQRLCWIG